MLNKLQDDVYFRQDLKESFNRRSSRWSVNTETHIVQPFDKVTDSNPNDEKTAYKFDRPIEYWLMLIGYAIGYGSFWRFPYLIYSCGGGIFFIPFLIFLFFLGIPLFTLECLMGQVFRSGPVEVLSMIKKKFQGVGWSTIITSWILSTYYAIILCWATYYFFLSFQSPLPWSKEAMDLAANNVELLDSEDEDTYMNLVFFKEQVLKISEGIWDMGGVDGGLAWCLLLTYIMIYFCIAKGIQSSSKVVYFTAPAPIVLLFILLFKALTLPGVMNGLKFLFLPDLSKLFEINVWIKACNQVVFMISCGIGGSILFASYRKETDDIYVSSFWIPVLTVCCGLLCSIINFSYLGHLSYLMDVPVSELPLSGTDLAFITYPSALCALPYPNLWSILFFFMLITLGIDSQFAFNEVVSHYVYEYWLNKYMPKTYCTALICFAGFLAGLPFIMNGGFYLFELVDNYATLISCFTILFLEGYILCRYVGVEVLKELVLRKTGKIISSYIYYCIEKVCPYALGALILLSFGKALSSNATYHAFWPYVVQWVVIIAPLSVIAYFLYVHRSEPEETKDFLKLAGCDAE